MITTYDLDHSLYIELTFDGSIFHRFFNSIIIYSKLSSNIVLSYKLRCSRQKLKMVCGKF